MCSEREAKLKRLAGCDGTRPGDRKGRRAGEVDLSNSSLTVIAPTTTDARSLRK